MRHHAPGRLGKSMFFFCSYFGTAGFRSPEAGGVWISEGGGTVGSGDVSRCPFEEHVHHRLVSFVEFDAHVFVIGPDDISFELSERRNVQEDAFDGRILSVNAGPFQAHLGAAGENVEDHAFDDLVCVRNLGFQYKGVTLELALFGDVLWLVY
jgi:hypothetical protein